MRENILRFVEKCEGYRLKIKNLHWAANNMSEHKLCDEIADSLGDSEDRIAEACQGLFGKFKPDEVKANQVSMTSTKAMIEDVVGECIKFHKELDGDEYMGIRSVVEDMIANFNQFNYLIDFCVLEDKLDTVKENVKNGGKPVLEVTASQMRPIVEAMVRKILKEDFFGNNDIDPYNTKPEIQKHGDVYTIRDDGEQVIVDGILAQVLVDHFYQIEEFIRPLDNGKQIVYMFDLTEKYGDNAFEEVMDFIESKTWTNEYENMAKTQHKEDMGDNNEKAMWNAMQSGID